MLCLDGIYNLFGINGRPSIEGRCWLMDAAYTRRLLSLINTCYLAAQQAVVHYSGVLKVENIYWKLFG